MGFHYTQQIHLKQRIQRCSYLTLQFIAFNPLMYDLIHIISSFLYFVYIDITTIFVQCRYYDDESNSWYEFEVLNNTNRQSFV